VKLCDALVTALCTWDVRHVYGVSGANIEHLHDAINRLGGTTLRSVLARSEVGAAYMAEASARVHGTLGVCCATSGGGMMNLAVGVAEARAEAVPMLAIVGQTPLALEGRGGFQDSSGLVRTVDALGLFGAIAKHVARVDDVAPFWDILESAVRAAMTLPSGPAVLLVPRDLFDLEVGLMPVDFPRSLDALRERGPAPDLTRLGEALRRAERPVLIWGTGVRRSGASQELRELVRTLRLPTVTTMGSFGDFPHDDPLFLGVAGAAGHPSVHDYLRNQADVVVSLGTELPVMVRGPFASAFDRARCFAIDISADRLCHAVPQAEIIPADPLMAVRALRAAWEKEPFVCAPVKAYELSRYEVQHVESNDSTAVEGLGATAALAVLQEFLPLRGHLLLDAGNSASTAIHRLWLPPGLPSSIALGMGGMGYSIAAAVAVQLGARQGERTLVLCGDGAFLMLGLEIHTAVELRLPILFVVFNDAKHGMCVTRQRLLFEGRIEASRYSSAQIAGIAQGLGSPDSLWVGRASTPDELDGLLRAYQGLEEALPGVLEVCITREELPPFAPFLSADAPRVVAARPRRRWPVPPQARATS